MKKILIQLIATICIISGCGTKQSKSGDLAGAGATFPLPFYKMSFKQYEAHNGITVAYGGIGSGGGIRSLKDEIVDFAGSDAFLSDQELTQMKPVIHIPTCLGAVVLAYNLPQISSLNLTGEIVADIFLGNITKWNDERIQSINKGVTLPALAITPVYRSDGSGTTFVFTDYLTKVSSPWKSSLGTGKSVNFRTGIAAKGNPGVSGTIAQTEGSIGYIGSEYAFAQQITIANLQNASGRFVKPSTQSISAAATGEIASDSRTMLTNAQNPEAYPISCFTWIIIFKEQHYANRSRTKAQATIDMLKYMLSGENQLLTNKIHYAPLPKSIRNQALQNLASVTYDGQPIQ